MINVILQEDVGQLDEVVVVGYGHQKKASVIGAISTVEVNRLQTNQTRSVSNSLAGQISGIIAVQRNGEPGYDASDFWIRGINTFGGGSTPLVLVDGVERSLVNISPEEIASFSVLKDATATAVYGVRGANGVILIETRRGQIGKPVITVKSDFGISNPTQLPQFVDGAKFMEVMNAAHLLSNPDDTPPYSQERIDKTRSGEDPDFYPSVNWLDAITRDNVPNRRASVDVNGGNELLRYSMILSYFGEEGILQTDPDVNYDAKIRLNRYNVRTNVDVNLTPSTQLSVGIGGYLMERNGPGMGIDWILETAFVTTPIIHPKVYSNGQLPRNPSSNNPWALTTQTGYVKRSENNIQSNISVQQDIGKLLPTMKGLNLKGTFSFDAWSWNKTNRTKNPTYYQAIGRDEEGNLITEILSEGQEFLGYSKEAGGVKTKYLELQMNYRNRFDDHSVDGLLLYNMRDHENHDATSAIYALPYRNQGLAGRLAYSYNDRYFTEFNFGYNGSENFKKGYRFGFFPSVALGWVISNESFMQGMNPWLSFLKLRGSYGLVGNDNLGGRRFAYVSTVNWTGGYQWGYQGDYWRDGLVEGDFGIPDLTWETATKANVGAEIGLFSKFMLQVDLFKEHRKDIFMQRKTIPELAGFQQAPWANFGKVDNKGIDISATYDHQLTRDLALSFRGNFTFARNRIVEYDESDGIKNSPRSLTGHSLNKYYALIADGLFSFDDFEDPDRGILKEGIPQHTFGEVRPGDIKYVDVNEDGRVDAFDMIPYGKPYIPEIIYGFGVSTKYRKVDFSLFFQGADSYSKMVNGNYFIPGSGGGGNGNIYANVDDRWTPENPSSDVFWPRLYNGSNSNNRLYSTWWLKDAAFLRLKNLELGYTLPEKWQRNAMMRNARLFFRGTNLFTWAAFDMWDPELDTTNGLRYPQQKIYTFGVEITF